MDESEVDFMKYLRHLFRQPLKTVTGIILVTIAVAILCVSVGQAYAVRSTEKNLHDQFTTIAIPSDTITMPEDLLSWLQTAAEAHPDIIKTIAKQNFISANIPGMTAMNFTNGNFIDDTQGALSKYTACPYPDGRPYTCVMLVVTVDEIGDAKELGGRVVVSEKLEREDFAFNEDYLEWKKNEMETMNFTYGFTQNFIGTVNQVVSLQEGFRDPTGMKVILTVSASTRKELNDCKLKPGEQYIVYSMSYYDEDWLIRSSLAAGTNSYNDFPIEIDAFDLSKFDLLTSAQRENYKKSYNVTAAPFALYDGRVYLGESDYKNANAVSMRLYSALPDRDFEIIRDGEKGKLIEIKYRTEYTYKDGDNYLTPLPSLRARLRIS